MGFCLAANNYIYSTFIESHLEYKGRFIHDLFIHRYASAFNSHLFQPIQDLKRSMNWPASSWFSPDQPVGPEHIQLNPD